MKETTKEQDYRLNKNTKLFQWSILTENLSEAVTIFSMGWQIINISFE